MRVSFQYQSIMNKKALNNSLNNVMSKKEQVDASRYLVNPESNAANYVMAYNIQRLIDMNAQFASNAKNADGWLGHAESQLKTALDRISEARNNLAIYGSNDIHSSESMQALAKDIQSIYQLLYDVGNTQYLGRYIFGGFLTDTKPLQDKENEVTHITEVTGKGGTLSAKDVFKDLEELESGDYTIEVYTKGDTGYLKLYDKDGKQVVLDSNGTDETTKTGNSVAKEITFKVEPNMVINTGRGVSIKLPEDIMTAGSLKYEFSYSAGSDASYFGDDGKIYNQIGSNQDIPINLTGRELFFQSVRILKGTKYNTIHGTPVNGSTKFSQIDSSGSNIGDSIKINGTDHLGRPVGAATVTAPAKTKLNLGNASVEERTLTIGYAGKYYKVEIPAKDYKNMDELSYTINRQLKNAQYAGSQSLSAHYDSLDQLEQQHNTEINAGLPVHDGAEYQVDLSGEISVSIDGDRLAFSTSTTGDNVILSVTGGKYNAFGFEDKTVAAIGKDTVFELGSEFDNQSGINTIYTQHNNVNLNGNPVFFVINGKTVQVDNLNLAATTEQRELMIDNAIKKAGLGSSVTVKLDPQATAGEYNVTFTLQNVNYNVDTHLSTSWNSGGVNDYQMMSVPKSTTGVKSEKTLNDLTAFIEELYGDTVKASIEDGRITIKDTRSGASKLSINLTENNQGIGIPVQEGDHILTGNYTGPLDSEWDIKTTVTNNGGNTDVTVEVYDKRGNLLCSRIKNNYVGDEIDLLHGVKIIVNDKDVAPGNSDVSNTSVVLTAKGSLSFGDINVTQEGKNADAFVSLDNLYDALMNEIVRDELKAPSAWKDESLKSSANPYFDGTFGGNYNSKWKYEIMAANGKKEFYLQNEFTQETGAVKWNKNITNADFTINMYNNATGQMEDYVINVPLAGAANDKDVVDMIVKAINSNDQLHAQGIHAVSKDGKIVFESGSGTKNINIIPNDDSTTYLFGSKKSSVQQDMKESSSGAISFNVNYFDGGAWATKTVNLPNGYTDITTALADINAQIGPETTASVINGKLTFNAAGATEMFYVDEIRCEDGSLGIRNSSSNYIQGTRTSTLDLSSASAEERSLSFKYRDALGEHSYTITVDQKAYNNVEELNAEINSQLNALGIGGMFEAMAGVDNTVMFKPAAGISQFTIEGDYKGTLGFAKTGDKVTINVTDDKGNTVQNINADTANSLYGVADGVNLGFDAGSLYASDSFTGVVGSGVRYELPVLDKVENQLLQMMTVLGNRRAQTETVINFQSQLKLTAESQKAYYLGGTETDKLNITTEYQQAMSAYEYSLSITTRLMSISILDFLS